MLFYISFTSFLFYTFPPVPYNLLHIYLTKKNYEYKYSDIFYL
jgi:hypothetical protein